MRQEATTIRIVLVDDHTIVRDGVRGYLARHADLTIVGEAASGEEAVQLASELLPDIVLMDLVMPGMGGVAATRGIRDVSPRSQVVVLTSFHGDEHIFPAIRAGARSYLLKDVRPQELVAAVRAAARDEATMHPHVAARVMAELSAPNYSEIALGRFAILTKREQEVLHLLAEGLSNAEITTRLNLSEATVKSHVSNILSKLHLADRTQAAVLAWREGFMKKDE
ncbi:MAG: response regulator transcription factor [Chloroflexota bacterium]